MKDDFLGPASSKLEDMLDWVLVWTGVALFILGLIGVIVVLIGYNIIKDKVLSSVFTFVSFYMFSWGAVLLKYHKSIVVRKK